MAIASGPNISAPADTVRVFATSGVFTPSFTGTVEVLVVAGGGGAGSDMGGGGGGGGVISNTSVAVTSGTPVTVTVGAAGAGAPAGTGGHATTKGTNGGNSVFGSNTAVGGGAGGTSYYTFGNSFGNSGGSGGGGSGYNNGVTPALSTGTGYGASGTGTAGQGNRGGWGNSSYYSGGGGGAGGAGTDANNTPNGGPGIANGILNRNLFWGGGGGGAAYSVSPGGNGGIGGGGGGAVGTTTGGTGYNNGSPGGGGSPNSQTNTPGGDGGLNTGGGGGGGSHYNFTNKGGDGGSGIVIVRYNSSLGESTGGAPISVGNMALCLDAANPNSNVGNRSIINWNNWTVGSGGVTGYNQNGATAENERVVASNPWGNNAVVWEARPLAQTNDDGGWNTADFAIDNTQLYRFSVWVRRTSSTGGGTFYLGTGSNGGLRKMSDNTAADNPYWECSGTSGLVQNTWYLFVGHIYPASTTFTGRNPTTGYYTINGRAGDINGCNIGTGDLKWNSNSTTSLHRTYLYYCADNTTRLQFYQPRVDLCDGTEPNIQELLQNAGNTWYDVSGSNNNCTFLDLPAANNGFYTFNGTSNYGTIINNATMNFASAQSLQIVMRHTYTSGRRNPWDQAYGGYGTWTHEQGDSITQFYGNAGANDNPYVGVSSPATPRSVWSVLCAVRSTTQFKWYLNGSLSNTSSNPYGVLANTPANITIGNGYAGFWQGDMAMVTAYTRALTDAEVAQNFNAIRGRFNL
jgi:hypothetical protein